MMTERKARFIREYLADRNATQAAKRAGYSVKCARVQGSRLLAHADVKSALAAQNAKDAARLNITREAITAELAKLGFSNMMDFIVVDKKGKPRLNLANLTREQGAAIAEVENARGRAKIKLTDKRAALMDLAKLCGYVIDKPALLAVSLDVLVNTSRDPKVVEAAAAVIEQKTNE
jgi:phage terminase small subunit